MASKAEVFIPVRTYTGLAGAVKGWVARIARAGRMWARQGQLGGLASTDVARYTGARI